MNLSNQISLVAIGLYDIIDLHYTLEMDPLTASDVPPVGIKITVSGRVNMFIKQHSQSSESDIRLSTDLFLHLSIQPATLS